MKTLLRLLATLWAGGIGLVGCWVAAPLFSPAATAEVELVAALPAPNEFARSFEPVPPVASLVPGLAAPAVGWRTPGEAEVDMAVAPPAEWLPPDWFPPSKAILVLSAMDDEGPTEGPTVKSRSAFVYDLDAGRVLYQKHPDDPRPVASITKVVSALAYASTDPNPDREVVIGPEQYPTRSGARSRLSTGDVTSGIDLLGAALVSSDNRAALGLAAAADMHLEQFVGRMNAVSVELGMTRSSWVDPSGLEDENLSTARDIAKATVAVATHPMLAPVASAPHWDLWRKNKNYVRRLGSTDRLSGRDDLVVETAKTGYTDTARYCFTTVLRTDSGHRLVISLLGADGKMTRWADVNRILSWVERQG